MTAEFKEAEEAWAARFSLREPWSVDAEAAADFLAGSIPLVGADSPIKGARRAGSGTGSSASRGGVAASSAMAEHRAVAGRNTVVGHRAVAERNAGAG